MFFYIGWMAVIIVHIVQSQNEVEFSIKTPIPYQCLKQLELKCTYTGNTSVCCSLTRVWNVNGLPVSTQAGKYQEGEINHNENYFVLLINDLSKADLKSSYSCSYDFDTLQSAVTLSEKCTCLPCQIRSVGMMCGGIAITGFMCFFFVIFWRKLKKCCKETSYVVGNIRSTVHLKPPQGLGNTSKGQITWYKTNGNSRKTCSEGTDVNTSLHEGRLNVTGEGLCISDVKRSDEGIYECELLSKADAAAPQVLDKIKLIVSNDKCRLAVAVAVFLATSFILNFVIAGPVGAYEFYYGEWMIGAGILTGLCGCIVAAIFDKVVRLNTDSKQTWPSWVKVNQMGKFVPLLILTAVEIIVVGFVVIIVIGEYFKGQCDTCGGKSFGWAATGSGIPMIIVIITLKYYKSLNWNRSFLFGILIFWRSQIVNVVVAVSFGIYLCPCTEYRELTFIILGLLYSLILVAVFWCLFDTEEDNLLFVLLFFGGIEIILAIFFCVVYCKSRKGGNNRSKESGSSCWPPCSVGPDPNSPDPENARSLLKKKADKKNEKKPVAVVRSQPPKNRHVKTDNTESTRYSAETEIFDEGVHKSAKPRPLPSIGQPTNSPRPLPQMPPSSQLEKGGIQLEPLGDSTAEKKKKKRKKKKESKQSDEEN